MNDKLFRRLQGGVFIGAACLVVSVGLRGLYPDDVPNLAVIISLGIEFLLLISLGVFFIVSKSHGGDEELLMRIHRILDELETDKVNDQKKIGDVKNYLGLLGDPSYQKVT